MTLPPKALNVLVDIKKSLLAKELAELNIPRTEGNWEPPRGPVHPEQAKAYSEMAVRKEKPPQMRKVARGSNSVFQRACRRREWWTPVY